MNVRGPALVVAMAALVLVFYLSDKLAVRSRFWRPMRRTVLPLLMLLVALLFTAFILTGS